MWVSVGAAQGQTSTIADTLPIDIQVDLLTTELMELVNRDDHAGVVGLMPQLRALAVDIPDSLYFIEARALFHTGDALAARDRLEVYLANSGREGRYYNQATTLWLQVKAPAAEQERKQQADAAMRSAKLEEEERKARVLRIREVQQRLHQVGFWLGPDAGGLDGATREAIAIYQVRRDLTVNADVTDELLDKLRSEAPDAHVCDLLAFSLATPLDSERPIEQIDGGSAIPACNEALRSFPHVVRFQIQYARALLSDGRNQDALLALQSPVDLKYPRALTLVGWMYESGRLAEKGRPDYEQALIWYRAAADKEYPEAQRKLGALYAAGNGVTRSDSAAYQWYRDSAEQGYAPAQVAVGELFEAGRGVNRDYVRALAWYTKAAEKDYAQAQYLLARMYERGRGTTRNKTAATAWYAKAADQGHSEAMAKMKRR